MSTAIFRCLSIEYEFMDHKLLPNAQYMPIHSEKHIQPIKDRLQCQFQNTTTFSFTSSHNCGQVFEEYMQWFAQKGIAQGKPEEMLSNINAQHRKSIVLGRQESLESQESLSKSTCLAAKRKRGPLSISV